MTKNLIKEARFCPHELSVCKMKSYLTTNILSYQYFAKTFFKWAILSLFFVYFQTNITIFTANKCEKCPFSIRCWDSNPWPSVYDSPPITTRPGLPPEISQKLATLNINFDSFCRQTTFSFWRLKCRLLPSYKNVCETFFKK